MLFRRLRNPVARGIGGGRWQPVADLAPAAATSVLFAFSGTAVSVPLAVAQLVPLLWRRHHPAFVLVAVGCATAAHTTLGMTRAIGFFPVTIALYTAAASRTPWIRWGLCPAVGVATAAASAARHGVVEGLLMAVVTVTVAWLAGVERGDHLRQRVEADRLRLEHRIAEQERAASEERERLARRVHDALAHTVTVMLVQTEAVKATAALDPAGQRRLDNVLQAGRQALTEVRAALARTEHPPALDERLARLCDAGLRLAGPLPELGDVLPPETRDVAERLIGEAAANALRHDGPGTLLTITTTSTGNELLLALRSEPAAPHPASPGLGFGLRSLADDVHSYGGTLTYGPATPAGWRLKARFPAGAHTEEARAPAGGTGVRSGEGDARGQRT